MIRRAFIRLFSGAVFATALGVKVETWKLEVEDDFWPYGIGGRDSEASAVSFEGLTPDTVYHWRLVNGEHVVCEGSGRLASEVVVRVIDRRAAN